MPEIRALDPWFSTLSGKQNPLRASKTSTSAWCPLQTWSWGRAGSAGTFQSLLPPGGAMSNSLARHQHLCEQAYSAPRVLRMPRGGGRERGWDLGDPGGLHPSLPASCFPGCLCAALSVAERNHGPRRQQTERRRPCFGFPDLTLGRPVCLPVWSWEFCGVYGHGYGCQYSWHLGLNGSLLRDQPAPLP